MGKIPGVCACTMFTDCMAYAYTLVDIISFTITLVCVCVCVCMYMCAYAIYAIRDGAVVHRPFLGDAIESLCRDEV